MLINSFVVCCATNNASYMEAREREGKGSMKIYCSLIGFQIDLWLRVYTQSILKKEEGNEREREENNID
jgi:hypothetical protein